MLLGGIEKIEGSQEIHLEIEMRVFDGDAHPGHRGQMHHGVESVLVEQAVQERGIPNVSRNELPLARVVGGGLHLGQVRAFAGGVVGGVQIVESDHPVAPAQQMLRQMASDKTGGSGDKDGLFHGKAPPRIWGRCSTQSHEGARADLPNGSYPLRIPPSRRMPTSENRETCAHHATSPARPLASSTRPFFANSKAAPMFSRCCR